MHERIRQRRKELGMNQTELAAKAEIKQATISAIELGKVDPTTSSIKKIAAALNVSLDYLILGTANKPPEREFSKQQKELLEIMQHMTEPEQIELLGAVKMYLSTRNPENAKPYFSI